MERLCRSASSRSAGNIEATQKKMLNVAQIDINATTIHLSEDMVLLNTVEGLVQGRDQNAGCQYGKVENPGPN